MKIVKNEVRGDKLKSTLNCEVRVHSTCMVDENFVAGLAFAQDEKNKLVQWFDIFNPINGTVYLTHPMDTIVEVEIKNAYTVGSLLWQIAKAYQTIFEEEAAVREKYEYIYKIWPLRLESLMFNQLRFYENGIIEVTVTS